RGEPTGETNRIGFPVERREPLPRRVRLRSRARVDRALHGVGDSKRWSATNRMNRGVDHTHPFTLYGDRRWLLEVLAVEDLKGVGVDLVRGAAAICVAGARGHGQHDHLPAVLCFVQVNPDLVGRGVLITAGHVRVDWSPSLVLILSSAVVRLAN